MRQQDFKLVQGVNQMVQMNAPTANLQGAAAAGGNAMARLGQQLAQTGQDVSNVMQYTAEAQDKTTLIRGRQKWKEIQAEQEAFQIENKKDPLSWEANRVKLMKKFDAYNSEAKLYTKNGKLNYQLSSEGFSSDFEIFTGKSVTKRINMNLADETIAEVKLALANNDPEGAEYALGQGGDSLTEDARATMQLQIKKGYEKRVMDNEKEMSKSDPAGYIEELKDRKDLTNDQQDKLFTYSSNQQNIQAREQLDDLEEAINTGDGVSLEDFNQMEEEGKFSQVPAGDLAKTKAGMERGLPLSNTELSKVNNILADLQEKKGELSEEKYMPYYNSKSAEIRSMIGTSKEYGWVTNALYTRNPFYKKDVSNNLLKQNKIDNKNEAIALSAYHFNRGDFSGHVPEYDADGRRKDFDPSLLNVEEREKAGKKQRELMREAVKYIDQQGEVLDTTEFSQWFGRKINGGKAAEDYKRGSGYQSPNRKPKVNTHKPKHPYQLKNKSWKQQRNDNSTSKVSNKANFGGSSGWTGGKTQKEVEQNLVEIQSPSGAPFKVNKTVAGNFESFLQELEDVVGYPINAESSAGYNWRKKRGKSSLSQHSYGNAIDINWDENKAFWGGEDAISKIPNIDEIAAKHGLVWGGSWKNKDTMQFEYHPSTGIPARGI